MQPERHQGEQDRAERRVVDGAQRVVQAAGLVGVVGDGRPAEQPADDGEGDALDDVADLAEPDDPVADTAGEVLGELLLHAAADEPDAQHDDRRPRPRSPGCGRTARTAAGRSNPPPCCHSTDDVPRSVEMAAIAMAAYAIARPAEPSRLRIRLNPAGRSRWPQMASISLPDRQREQADHGDPQQRPPRTAARPSRQAHPSATPPARCPVPDQAICNAIQPIRMCTTP